MTKIPVTFAAFTEHGHPEMVTSGPIMAPGHVTVEQAVTHLIDDETERAMFMDSFQLTLVHAWLGGVP